MSSLEAFLTFVTAVALVCGVPVLVLGLRLKDDDDAPYDDDTPARPRVEVAWRPAAPGGCVGWGSFAHVRCLARRPFDWQHDDRDMAAMGERNG